MTVIDSHAHIAAPAGVFSYQARLIASGGYQERTAILLPAARLLTGRGAARRGRVRGPSVSATGGHPPAAAADFAPSASMSASTLAKESMR